MKDHKPKNIAKNLQEKKLKKEEKKREKQMLKGKLFRLIDSFIPENIDLALAMITHNQSLKDACKNRYYPLMRKVDPAMGRSFQILKDIVDKIANDYSANFALDVLIHYHQLNEPEAIAHSVKESILAKVESISDADLIEKICTLENLPDNLFKKI